MYLSIYVVKPKPFRVIGASVPIISLQGNTQQWILLAITILISGFISCVVHLHCWNLYVHLWSLHSFIVHQHFLLSSAALLESTVQLFFWFLKFLNSSVVQVHLHFWTVSSVVQVHLRFWTRQFSCTSALLESTVQLFFCVS